MSLEGTQDLFSQALQYAAPEYVPVYETGKRVYSEISGMARESIKSKKSRTSKKTSKSSRKKSLKKASKRSRKANVDGVRDGTLGAVIADPKDLALYALMNVSPNPFPRQKTMTLQWRGIPLVMNVNAYYSFYRLRVNDCFNPDYDNGFGGAQPQYWDQLTGSTGPYRSYRVNRWSVVWQVMNTTTLDATSFYSQNTGPLEVLVASHPAASDCDTIAEIRARTDVTRVMLSPPGAETSRCDIILGGSIKEFQSLFATTTAFTNYAASPTNAVFQTIFVSRPDAIAALRCCVVPTITFDVTLGDDDGISS